MSLENPSDLTLLNTPGNENAGYKSNSFIFCACGNVKKIATVLRL